MSVAVCAGKSVAVHVGGSDVVCAGVRGMCKRELHVI